MNAHAQASLHEAERQFIERLRIRYEDEGYTFESSPDAAHLPDFLRPYTPDAVATKRGKNIAIEIKRRPSPSTEPSLKRIRRLFEGHPDWQLRVVFMGVDTFQSMSIPAATPAVIRTRVEEVRALVAQGHRRPAFVTAWSLLEAALAALNPSVTRLPRTPGTVVQTLAMDGLIDPDLETQLHTLIELRDRIVHGDLEAEPSPDAIELVLTAVDNVLGITA